MVATRHARAAASASSARAARLFESLDLGVLSVVASFGYPEELVELGVALGKARGAELLGYVALGAREGRGAGRRSRRGGTVRLGPIPGPPRRGLPRG